MRNFKLTLSYDGTGFFGWQTQPGFRTVQETLEAAIADLTGERIRVNTSGRTDTGVHALGQVVNFYSATQLDAETLVRAVNARLPEDVVIAEAVEMPQSFDANRDAKRKLYRYAMHDGPTPNLFKNGLATNVGGSAAPEKGTTRGWHIAAAQGGDVEKHVIN